MSAERSPQMPGPTPASVSLAHAPSPMEVLRLGLSVGRIAASVLSERIRPPVARTVADVPARIEDITPQWLSEVLKPTAPSSAVAAVSIDGGSSGTSVRGRLHLSYEESDVAAPTTLFAKSTPSFTTRIANGITGTAISEAGFYRQLRPQLSVEAPVGYHCAVDEGSWRSIQLIEDLVITKGATFCSPARVLAVAEAEQMIGQLALLHAEAAEMTEVHTRPAWLRSYLQWWQQSVGVVAVRRGHLRGMAAALDNGLVPQELRGKGEELWEAFTRSVLVHRNLPPTLLHGDAHLGNWYITGEGAMGLCDWQCVSVGHWSRDLAYALTSALTIEQRRSWERDLIELYLGLLKERGGDPPGFATAWEQYRLQVLGALMMWAPTYRPPPLMPDMQPIEVSEEMLRRITTAVVDLESLAA